MSNKKIISIVIIITIIISISIFFTFKYIADKRKQGAEEKRKMEQIKAQQKKLSREQSLAELREPSKKEPAQKDQTTVVEERKAVLGNLSPAPNAAKKISPQLSPQQEQKIIDDRMNRLDSLKQK